jgi:hypothetical protein
MDGAPVSSNDTGILSRRALLWLCALAAVINLGALATQTVLQWYGDQGLDFAPTGTPFIYRVTSVYGPALKAGVQVGDRIDIRRDYLWQPTIPGQPYNITALRRTAVVPITITPVQSPFTWDSAVRFLSVFWLLAFAALIARNGRTKGSALLAMAMIAIAIESGAGHYVWPSALATAMGNGFVNIAFIQISLVLLAIFAANCARPLSRERMWLTRTAVTLAALSAVLSSARVLGYVTPWFDPRTGIFVGATPLYELSIVACMLCGVFAFFASSGGEKQRVAWVFLSFGLFWGVVFFNSVVQVTLNPLQNSAFFIIPLGLTYAALSRRMFDVGFVLNRAAVVAGVSVIVVGAFVVLEWALGRWFENASHTTSLALNVGLALALGISLRYIHRLVDRFVDRVMFRKRHEDESALRRFAHEASFISDHSTLLERAAQTVKEHTSADNAAILIRDRATSYTFATDGRRELVSQDDPGIVALRAWHKPVDLHEVKDSALHGEFAFPMISRGELVGALICGPKRDGEAYAPDESDALLALAHGVGSALDVLSASRNGESSALQEIRDELRALRKIVELTRPDGPSRG